LWKKNHRPKLDRAVDQIIWAALQVAHPGTTPHRSPPATLLGALPELPPKGQY
jgi:hypothetical protein